MNEWNKPDWNYHVLYQTTRIEDGAYYIGAHTTKDIRKPYYGSGRWARDSMRAHGRSAHSVSFLKFFADRAALRRSEKELITERLDDPLCMNMRRGGGGEANNLTPEERKELGDFYGPRSGNLGAITSKERGVGIFALTPEQLSENGKKGGRIGGKIGGKASVERRRREKSGIFGLTSEQRAEASRSAVKSRMENRTQEERSAFAKKAAASRTYDYSQSAKTQVTCPHCGKTGSRLPMSGRHFDRCKHKGVYRG